jgi:hypothetical protein
VTETARRCGFKMRVVLSRRLWDFIEGPPDACRDEAETLERLDRLLKMASRELLCEPGVNFDWVQTDWLQLSRDRKPLNWREKAQVRGSCPWPVACSTGHYSPAVAETGRSGDLS